MFHATVQLGQNEFEAMAHAPMLRHEIEILDPSAVEFLGASAYDLADTIGLLSEWRAKRRVYRAWHPATFFEQRYLATAYAHHLFETLELYL
jgi:hypothetical protein